MNYYGELPSYCKGLRKCPVDGLEKSKMMVFLTANANTKCTACLLVCLSKSQFAIIAGKVHNISNMKSPPLKNQPTNQQTKQLHSSRNVTHTEATGNWTYSSKPNSQGWLQGMTRWSEPSYTPCTGWQTALPPGFQPWGNGKRAKPEGQEKRV